MRSIKTSAQIIIEKWKKLLNQHMSLNNPLKTNRTNANQIANLSRVLMHSVRCPDNALSICQKKMVLHGVSAESLEV